MPWAAWVYLLPYLGTAPGFVMQLSYSWSQRNFTADGVCKACFGRFLSSGRFWFYDHVVTLMLTLAEISIKKCTIVQCPFTLLLYRTVARKFSIWGFAFLRGTLCLCEGAWHSKIWQNSTDLQCFVFQFGGLGVLFGGISPPKHPRNDGTASLVVCESKNVLSATIHEAW